MINERPSDNPVGSMGGFGGAGPEVPSIGNYKGVMLCNRPNESGAPRKADRTGAVPFSSMVRNDEPMGWNPTAKLAPRGKRKKV